MALPASSPPLQFQARSRRRRALISLTPLIDVVFILLVFFMLASSFFDWRSIDLAAPGKGTAVPKLDGAMLVEVRDDMVRLAGAEISLDDLQQRINARIQEMPDQRILVRPAAGVSLQRAVAVVDRISQAGGANVSLVRGEGR
jgi:biopolymer transport protein ExbD